MADVKHSIVAKAPDQGVVPETAVERVIAVAAIEYIGLFIAGDRIGMAGAADVFNTAQDVRLRGEQKPRANDCVLLHCHLRRRRQG